MSRVLLALLLLAGAGCASRTPDTTPPNVREIAGTWQGRLALGGANAPASVTIKEDGTLAGALHVEGGDRPFTGAIVVASPGRLRYLGTLGEGTVVVTPPNGPPAALQLVPDGGGGGGSLTRAK